MFAGCRLCPLPKQKKILRLGGRSKTIRANSKITVLFSHINHHYGGKCGKHRAWKRRGGGESLWQRLGAYSEAGCEAGGLCWLWSGNTGDSTMSTVYTHPCHLSPVGKGLKPQHLWRRRHSLCCGARRQPACRLSAHAPRLWCGVWRRWNIIFLKIIQTALFYTGGSIFEVTQWMTIDSSLARFNGSQRLPSKVWQTWVSNLICHLK